MNWNDWCRLCGHFETLSKVDLEVEEIIKIFNLELTIHDTKICINCNQFLNDIHHFMQKSKDIQGMFKELETEFNYEKNINDIRSRFSLKPVVDFEEDNKDQEILESLFDDGSALEIKIESEIHIPIADSNILLNRIYAVDIDDEEDENEHDEEASETSSRSMLDNLKNQGDLSENEFDDDQEMNEVEEEKQDVLMDLERSKKRKKTRKFEEKLFDFVCHICKEEFDKMSQLSDHCRKIHSTIPQVICFCGKTLGTMKRLLIHKQKHFPEKFQYECKECKMVYKMKNSYLNHMKHKHGSNAKKFVCSQCARCFKDSRTLKTHEKTHLPDELKLCEKCGTCGKKFVNKNSLKSHIISVHEMANLYTCEQCGKCFSTKSNLKSHLYSHSNEKIVQCENCSARFKNMDSLRKHKKTHLDKSHECSLCGNRYRNRNNLKAHMVCHSDVKPFKCSYCSNEYKRSKDLKCHMNLHTGLRPYTCQFCSRSFVNGSNCRKHKLKDHAEELAEFEKVHGRGKAAVFALNCIKHDDS